MQRFSLTVWRGANMALDVGPAPEGELVGERRTSPGFRALSRGERRSGVRKRRNPNPPGLGSVSQRLPDLCQPRFAQHTFQGLNVLTHELENLGFRSRELASAFIRPAELVVLHVKLHRP